MNQKTTHNYIIVYGSIYKNSMEKNEFFNKSGLNLTKNHAILDEKNSLHFLQFSLILISFKSS